MRNSTPILIVGAGPAGLMAADVLSAAGLPVRVVDHKPSAGRKFLMAGKGGLNISHSEPLADFIQRYDAAERLAPLLDAFGPHEVVNWMAGLGFAAKTGSSGRIFPDNLQATPLLRRWLERLTQQGVQCHYRTRWLGWTESGHARLQREGQEPITLPVRATVLATGGKSWARLGSDGQALDWLATQGILQQPVVASNAGVRLAHSSPTQALAGHPLKRVRGWVNDAIGAQQCVTADAILSTYGLEGGLIYALNRRLREASALGNSKLILDLYPDLSVDQLSERLKRQNPRQSLSSRWRKAGIEGAKAALLRDHLARADWEQPERVACAAKGLVLIIDGFQPIDEAISTAGGVAFEALDEHWMLRDFPGVYCCGEMVAWDAPTGGYLLTACLSSGHWVGQQLVAIYS